VVSNGRATVESLSERPKDWRVAWVDTGVWRNIGERLWAVRHPVRCEDMFLADYSDGLSDAPLDHIIETFKASGKVACFLAVHPKLTCVHRRRRTLQGMVRARGTALSLEPARVAAHGMKSADGVRIRQTATASLAEPGVSRSR
jgi:hypothetical protein